MQESPTTLARAAIEAALSEKWTTAIELNLKILDQETKNINAKIRLGRAYLELSEFSKAKKCFAEVLEADPINTIAQKNYQLAKNRKRERNNRISVKQLIKEPGTYTETQFFLTPKDLTVSSFTLSEELNLQLEGNSAKVLKGRKIIGTLNDKMAKRLIKAKAKKASLTAKFGGGEGKEVLLKIYSDISVFKTEKQEVKPYMKKGSIEEPAIDSFEIEEE